ncbi:MAG: hypothetical protein Q9160_000536 [Pyrenula sp. 1 TL-2023]
MAQGAIKAKVRPKPNSKPSRANSGITKKGPRFIAPRKAALLKQQKASRKMSAGLAARTEKMLGERAGHLEMLAGAKKERKGNQDSKLKKESAANATRKKSSQHDK